jgi:hypothetical protein
MNTNSYLSQWGTVSCYYIQGNYQNGGENTDNGEDLVLDILGVNYNVFNTTIISLGSTSYPNSIFSLFTHVLTSSEVASGYYIRFRQTSSSQSAFDTYGMKWLNLQYGILGGTDIRFENLPTTTPSENGRVWNNNGFAAPHGAGKVAEVSRGSSSSASKTSACKYGNTDPQLSACQRKAQRQQGSESSSQTTYVAHAI